MTNSPNWRMGHNRSAGVNGTNDWQEDENELTLQTGRWYPSAMTMSNGSILVTGGEIGSNSAGNPTLEILPKLPGGYIKFSTGLTVPLPTISILSCSSCPKPVASLPPITMKLEFWTLTHWTPLQFFPTSQALSAISWLGEHILWKVPQ